MTADKGEEPVEKRRYVSPLRRERAAETRAGVVEAAAEMFLQHGYEGATVARIAAAAGVSVDTVVNTGPKPHLLLDAFQARSTGEAGPGTMVGPSFGPAVAAVTGPDEALDMVVELVAAAHAASAGLWTIIRATARTDPRIAEAFDELRQSRDASYDAVVDWLVDLGAVPAPADPAAHRLDGRLALSAEHYHLLTADCGMDGAEYRSWLRSALVSAG